ncbi:pantothenate synthetase [bacterium BMS3Abin07]|nr:pantothenate synthetase [bacterium BMS3Abin07]GBE33181.1 pantothenate synthetase [bacterium BMS3Bbin05]
MKKIEVVRSPKVMTALAKECLQEGLTIGFVPTMGAFHKGHLSLVKRSTAENDVSVVSIFVNPAQFGPSEDFKRYPRDLEGDLEKLRELKVDTVFSPEPEDLYPGGYLTYVNVEGLSEGLCGTFRPGHFRGVATIVTKLFNIVLPTRAYFGQKDYQQARILQTMASDLNMDIDVIVCPIVREEDGLAMSSRNAYMDEEERRAATIIYRALTKISNMLAHGELPVSRSSDGLRNILLSEPLVDDIQYASAYDPETLEELKQDDCTGEVLLAVALKIGRTRLIDNMIVKI